MILFKTHIRADEPSPRSGIVYTHDVLSSMANMDLKIPGAFGVDIDNKTLTEAAIEIEQKRRFECIGFDLIDGALYLKLSAEERVADIIYEDDYVSRLIIDAVFDDIKNIREVKSVRGVVLIKDSNGKNP